MKGGGGQRRDGTGVFICMLAFQREKKQTEKDKENCATYSLDEGEGGLRG